MSRQAKQTVGWMAVCIGAWAVCIGMLIGLGPVYPVFAQHPNTYYRTERSNLLYNRDVIYGQGFGFVPTSVALTSPTVAFPVLNRGLINLSSNVSQVGLHPLGGYTGDLVIIKSGTGTTTMSFTDDATSLTLGANIVLAGSQNDILALYCVLGPASQTGYGKWARLFSADN